MNKSDGEESVNNYYVVPSVQKNIFITDKSLNGDFLK